jgi:hypothetical protein
MVDVPPAVVVGAEMLIVGSSLSMTAVTFCTTVSTGTFDDDGLAVGEADGVRLADGDGEAVGEADGVRLAEGDGLAVGEVEGD